MKTKYLLFLSLITFVAFTGCDNKEDRFIDLESGKTITVEKDSTTGFMVNGETKEPVGIYVNTATNDTFYGRTGKVINNSVVKSSDGKYTYRDGDVEVREGGNRVKVKVEGNGGIDVTDDDYKKKVDADGDIKIKDDDTKIKIDKDGSKKVKNK